MSTQQVTIDRLGGQGDGIGSIDGELVYVPFSLPGETVSIERERQTGSARFSRQTRK